jgi:hypothetical protein
MSHKSVRFEGNDAAVPRFIALLFLKYYMASLWPLDFRCIPRCLIIFFGNRRVGRRPRIQANSLGRKKVRRANTMHTFSFQTGSPAS